MRLALFLILLTSACSHTPRWLVYYGNTLDAKTLDGVELAILEPDAIDARPLKNGKTKFVGYVSVGEISATRSYFEDLRATPLLVGENPNWPGAHIIDVRIKVWQEFLIKHVIPQILSKGYDGVFLDTIDSALYLEEMQPETFYGTRLAVIDLIKNIRKNFPTILIIPNAGLDVLKDYQHDIDGVVIEDLYTHYDFITKTSTKTPESDSQFKETRLNDFIAATKKPVYNILYADSPKSELARYGIERSKKHGYDWYITTIDLNTIGSR